MDLEAYVARLARAREDLALRQRPSAYAFALSDAIDLVRADHWDAVVSPDDAWLGRAYLGALERAQPPNMGFRYALCYDGRTPVAAAAFQVFDVALDAVGSREPAEPSLRTRMLDMARAVGDALGSTPRARLLVAGNAEE